MGRELKRVPLDFNWPLNITWGGYLNPYGVQQIECPDCKGLGRSPESQHLHDLWYGYTPFKPEDRGSIPFTINDAPIRAFAEKNINHSPDFYGTGEQAIVRESQRVCRLFNKSWSHHLNSDDIAALIENGRLIDFTHTWTKDKGWVKKEPPYIPTPKEVNNWSIFGFGHDSINSWVVIESECKRLGYETICHRCKGEGNLWPTIEIKKQYDEWERIEPPKGEGYQIWETVSAGSPISPVFATPEELAKHMSETRWGADQETTYEQWLKFINGPGWAPSGIMKDGEFKTGVQSL